MKTIQNVGKYISEGVMKKTVSIILAMLLMCPLAYAYQFEDYKFGMTEQEVETIARGKPKETNIPPSLTYATFGYDTKMMGDVAHISFSFTHYYTPKSLRSISVQWSDALSEYSGKPIFNALAEKYGNPDGWSSGAPYIKEATWTDSENGDTIRFSDGGNFIILNYTSKQYNDLDTEMRKELQEKDAHRF